MVEREKKYFAPAIRNKLIDLTSQEGVCFSAVADTGGGSITLHPDSTLSSGQRLMLNQAKLESEGLSGLFEFKVEIVPRLRDSNDPNTVFACTEVVRYGSQGDSQSWIVKEDI